MSLLPASMPIGESYGLSPLLTHKSARRWRNLQFKSAMRWGVCKHYRLFQTTMGRVANLILRQMGSGKWFGVNIAQGRLELEECDITSQSLACVTIQGGADPRLVYCSISGYGRTGLYADWPGYDPIIQAEGGMMGITGLKEGPPYRVGVPIVDITAGMFAAAGVGEQSSVSLSELTSKCS